MSWVYPAQIISGHLPLSFQKKQYCEYKNTISVPNRVLSMAHQTPSCNFYPLILSVQSLALQDFTTENGVLWWFVQYSVVGSYLYIFSQVTFLRCPSLTLVLLPLFWINLASQYHFDFPSPRGIHSIYLIQFP